jgi:hypothetical protein
MGLTLKIERKYLPILQYGPRVLRAARTTGSEVQFNSGDSKYLS